MLERDQLKALLTFLSPEHPPDEEALNIMMEKAISLDTTGDGNPDTTGAHAP